MSSIAAPPRAPYVPRHARVRATRKDWDRAFQLLDARRGDAHAEQLTLALLTGPLATPMANAR